MLISSVARNLLGGRTKEGPGNGGPQRSQRGWVGRGGHSPYQDSPKIHVNKNNPNSFIFLPRTLLWVGWGVTAVIEGSRMPPPQDECPLPNKFLATPMVSKRGPAVECRLGSEVGTHAGHRKYSTVRSPVIHCVPKKGSHQTLGSNFVKS